MGRVLGWIFNRWVLGTLLFIALALLIWHAGPLIRVGEARPLDSERERWWTILALALLTLASVAWRMWRARRGNSKVVDQLVAAPKSAERAESADLAAVRKRFQEALETLRKTRFAAAGDSRWQGLKARLSGKFMYQLPWYVFIGAPGSGKTTALRNSGLQFPLASKLGDASVKGVGGTRHCDWWFTDQAVLIDTAGRFTTQDSDRANDSQTWSGFLDLLKRSRPRQPLNGVLVTVSISDLIDRGSSERARLAATVRERLQELYERLQIRFPIYLLVTKCDLMAGFMDTFAALDKEQRAAAWGFTFGLDGDGQSTGFAAFDGEYDALQQRLNDGLIDRLQAETDARRRARIYGFPLQFAGLRGALHEFVDAVFSPSPYEARPLLRGVYFISGTQEGTPIDRMLGAIARRYQLERAILPPLQASGRSFFLSRLLREVVFAEHGLAGTNRRWERRRDGLAWAGYAALGLTALVALVAWSVSFGNNRRYIDSVSERVQAVRRQVQETPNRASADLTPVIDALDATRGLAAAGREVDDVPWSFGFGLYQGRKLDGAARTAYEQMLVDAVLPRLALRVAEQLRLGDQQELQYEALKAYLMMYQPERFDAAALKAYIESDWDARVGRDLSIDQRARLSAHLDALLAQGPAVSPLAQDKALIDSARLRLGLVGLPQRVYNRMRQGGFGTEFPEFTVVRAGGGNAPLVFMRPSGLPLTKGVPGLFSFNGYHKGFQPMVGATAKQLADEQEWVLGVKSTSSLADNLATPGRLLDDVRRLYLNEYASTWEAFIADVRLVPVTSISQSLQTTRVLAAPDSPLPPLLKAMSIETTLLAGNSTIGAVTQAVTEKAQGFLEKAAGSMGVKAPITKGPTTGAPSTRIESLVDDRFAGLRRMVTAPEGGKAPIDGIVARLGELQVHLTAVDAALKGGAAPPANPLPTQLKAEAANAPEPVRSLLDNLGSTSAKVALMQLRESLSRDVRSQIGEFCQQAVAGRYPFDRLSNRDVTQADFAALFGPGGKFDQVVSQRLAPYVDTSTRPWTFRAVDGTPLGADHGTLPQFQRAAAIRETFFPAGAAGMSVRLEFKPVEMDPGLTQFVLDVDGQVVRYAHGPQIPTPVQWPGPRGTGLVRLMVTPAGSTGLVAEGPWALFRLFERVGIQPGASPERFRAVFDIDGRKATFDVTTSSVRNPFRLAEMKDFACPNGL